MNSVDNLKNAARRWLRALRAGNAQAQARLRAAYPKAPSDPGLRDVQHALAREQGHPNWIALLNALRPAAALDAGDPMQPVELRREFPMALHDGLWSTTTEVWRMLSATRAGDLDTVRAIVDANPAMACCEHNYLPPLQLAVREQHIEIVAYLLEHGAYDPKFETYPYRESIHQVAADRGTPEIEALLERHRIAERPRTPSAHETGSIDFSSDAQHVHRSTLERLITQDALDGVKAMLEEHPNLLHDPLLFWGEGILAAPTNSRQHKMIDLLLDLGARVPDVAKWAPFYFFKHLDVAKRLIEAGMSARHMNWHRTTLLHHMAWAGDIAKATLLLDHGADINAIDDEFRRTPLGLAEKAGREDMVRLLRDRSGV